MRKEILAAFCVLTIMASTAPIFAADTSNTTPVVLTEKQLTKLNAIQTELTRLVTKIESLKTTYNNTKKGKGLLTSLNMFEKQANKLNKAITYYKNNPTVNANLKIKHFQIRTHDLQWKVAITGKVLKIINTPKPIHPIVPVHPIAPVHPIKHPVKPVVPVHPVTNTSV